MAKKRKKTEKKPSLKEDLKSIKKPKGLRVMMSVKDVISHKKTENKTVSMFGSWGADEKLATFSLNINNVTPVGMQTLKEALGVRTIEMETPIVLEAFVPEGALLDHYKDETKETKLEDHEED